MGEPMIQVGFRFVTGVRRPLFENVRLCGSWDEDGHVSRRWSEVPMTSTRGEDGCPAFVATVGFDPGMAGREVRWGVKLDGALGSDLWGIPTEVPALESRERHRSFVLRHPDSRRMQIETCYLTHCRRLGAQKHFLEPGSAPGIRFAVWAPHAWKVEVVFGQPAHGYLADDGTGMDRGLGPFELEKGPDGVWASSPETYRELREFTRFEGRPYMYRITLKSGKEVYRTDLHSRAQAGRGEKNPRGRPYVGTVEELDGTVSCSLVTDPDTVNGYSKGRCAREFGVFPTWEFWKDELRGERPRVRSVGDLVIYELHVGALGAGKGRPGTLGDALEFLDHVAELGVNALELMPIAEFSGWASWGYGPSHLFAPEGSAGGRHLLAHFVREAHRRGLLVILDVVYNHFASEGLRAQWQYDSLEPEENLYYWYQGRSAGYPHPDGGYLDNGSSGFSPDFSSEMLRRYLISAAVEAVEEYQVDGLRVDLLDAIHRNHVLHQTGMPVEEANLHGARFLRELTRTLRLLRPELVLIAEDHSGDRRVLAPVDEDGFGFDARWQASFYHHLIGDAQPGEHYARLLHRLATRDEGPVPLRRFAEALAATEPSRIVYHEAHDEAGNSSYLEDGERKYSKRTLQVAAAGREPRGATRFRAERLCRLAVGLSMLSRGTPMFLMGEEVTAQEEYRFDDFLWHREDLRRLREGPGRAMFRFYQDLIRLRRRSEAIRAGSLQVLLADDEARMLIFRRRHGVEDLLVVVNGNPVPFPFGYRFHGLDLPDRTWHEFFDSDSVTYGGDNVGNAHRPLVGAGGTLEPVLPAHGFLILR